MSAVVPDRSAGDHSADDHTPAAVARTSLGPGRPPRCPDRRHRLHRRGRAHRWCCSACGSGSGLSSTFGLADQRRERHRTWPVPARPPPSLIGIMCTVLGGILLCRGFRRRAIAATADRGAVRLRAFLVWASRARILARRHAAVDRCPGHAPGLRGPRRRALRTRPAWSTSPSRASCLPAPSRSAFVASADGQPRGPDLVVGPLRWAVLGLRARRASRSSTSSTRSSSASLINIFALGITELPVRRRLLHRTPAT